jgi:hypothetical protein
MDIALWLRDYGVAVGTFTLAGGTFWLAYISFRTVKQNYDFRKQDIEFRKQDKLFSSRKRALDEILRWTEDALDTLSTVGNFEYSILLQLTDSLKPIAARSTIAIAEASNLCAELRNLNQDAFGVAHAFDRSTKLEDGVENTAKELAASLKILEREVDFEIFESSRKKLIDNFDGVVVAVANLRVQLDLL